MTKFILVRHGQSEANKKGLFAGHSDFPLSELGLLQAEKTAEYILENHKIDIIYSSDLKRAYSTALPVSKRTGIEIIPDTRLREIYAGEWEAMKFEDIAEKFPEDRTLWKNDIANSRPTCGESVREIAARILSRLTEIGDENDGKTVLVTFHATPIRSMQALWQTGGLEYMKEINWVPNASVTVAEYENGEFTLKSIGDNAHLSELNTNLPPTV